MLHMLNKRNQKILKKFKKANIQQRNEMYKILERETNQFQELLREMKLRL